MKTLSLVAAVCALVATPVMAQESESVTGSRFSREKHDDKRNARKVLAYFGTCVAAYKSDKIEAFLVDPTQATWDPVIYAPNNQTRCAMANMTAGFREYAGTVSEAWYVRRFKDGAPASFTTGEQKPPPQDDLVARLEASDPEDHRYIFVEEFSRCVAATAPMQVDALLRTDVETKAEQAAIRSVVPFLGACMFEGQDLKLDAESLRSMLAYALAKRAVHTLDGNH